MRVLKYLAAIGVISALSVGSSIGSEDASLASILSQRITEGTLDTTSREIEKSRDLPDDALVAIFERSQTLYVYVIQRRLLGDGYRKTAPNGTLDRATIQELLQFCGDNGLGAACEAAPLSEKSAALLSPLILERYIEPVALKVEYEQKPPLVGSTSLGQNGKTEVQVSGKAAADGFFNVYLSDPLKVSAGQTWRIRLTVDQAALDTPVVLRVAVRDANGKYVGELFDGEPVSSASVVARISSQGKTAANAATVRPYLQILVRAGEDVSATVLIRTLALAAE